MKQQREKIAVTKKRKWMRAITIIAFFYGSIGIALFYLQQKILFHPDQLSSDFQFHFDKPFKEVNIPMNGRDTINMVQFLPTGPPKGVVLYFHGNKGNIIRFAKYADNFTKNGYEVWMPDYPGYGKTTGPMTEANFYAQATQVYKLAHSQFGADSIVVYGKSLGTGVAAYLACKQKISRLILETPYYSIPSLFSLYAPIYPTQRMSQFKFPVGEYLNDVSAPVTIFHGNKDRVVFYRNSIRLKLSLKPSDEFITIDGGGHNNLNDYKLFHEKLDSLLR
ncbi:MAG: alpha/beta fold hydrolase [Bacteroidetes bacterium]|nr:alpha/beta fold hydrolase [Bacteroidota bacterium]